MPIPEMQKALVLLAKCADYVIRSVPVPSPSPGQLLVKIHSAALNPIDWKTQKSGVFIDQYPAVLGCDIAGTVEVIVVGVEDFSLGDRVSVAFLILVGEPADAPYRGRISQGFPTTPNGAFQQYALVYADVTAKVGRVLENASDVFTDNEALRCPVLWASTRPQRSLWDWGQQPWGCSPRMSGLRETSTVWV